LIGNAIKFTKAGQTPKIIVGSHPGGTPEKVVFYIQDNGIGFKMKDQETIFQTFQQLSDQDNQGAGIGLSIAKIIISKHGGEIWAEAEKGSGATFFFELSRPEAVEYEQQV
jgi:signal transduction histidine kinase